MLLEVIGDLVMVLHAQEGFGIARAAAALFPRRPFEQRHPGPLLPGRHCGVEAGNAATDDDDVEFILAHGAAIPERMIGRGERRGFSSLWLGRAAVSHFLW